MRASGVVVMLKICKRRLHPLSACKLSVLKTAQFVRFTIGCFEVEVLNTASLSLRTALGMPNLSMWSSVACGEAFVWHGACRQIASGGGIILEPSRYNPMR